MNKGSSSDGDGGVSVILATEIHLFKKNVREKIDLVILLEERRRFCWPTLICVFFSSPMFFPSSPLTYTDHTTMALINTMWLQRRRRAGRPLKGAMICLTLVAFTSIIQQSKATSEHASIFSRIMSAFQPQMGDSSSSNNADSRGRSLQEILSQGEKVDVWENDGILKLMQKAIKGDHLSLLTEMGKDERLVEIWSQPTVVHRLLRSMPMLQGLKGAADIAAKNEEDVTPEDVS